jgi:putative ABC transport system permease protein
MIYFGRVLTTDHSPAGQQKMANMLKTRLEEGGISVSGVTTGTEVIQQSGFAINILIYVLLVMAVLIAIVGGLGLMGTMGMNVMERTREIGVMRSLGAVDMSIMQLVVIEGMIIGVVSWALGALFSIPITYGLNYMLGVALLNVPMAYAFSPSGLIIWVIIVIFLSALASILPARNAVRLTVRDILAYE